MNFRLMAKAKARCRFSQRKNYTAGDGLGEVGQRTGFLGFGLSEPSQRLGSAPQLQMKPRIPSLGGKGGRPGPNLWSQSYHCLNLQWRSGVQGGTIKLLGPKPGTLAI